MDSVAKKSSRLGIYKSFWCIKNDEFLIKNYGSLTIKEAAKKLGRTENSISKRTSKLRLIKTSEQLSVTHKRAYKINRNYPTGKNSHLWKGGVAGDCFYAKGYWRDIRNNKIAEDKVCFCCHSTEDLVVHHKKFRRDGGNDEDKNLVVLCRKCHAKIHTLESFYRNNHVIKPFERIALEVIKKFHENEN